jgi:peptide/nickel transport system substrate-binding protein
MTDHRLSTSARLTQRLTDRRLDRRSVLSLGLGFGTLLTLSACTPP